MRLRNLYELYRAQGRSGLLTNIAITFVTFTFFIGLITTLFTVFNETVYQVVLDIPSDSFLMAGLSLVPSNAIVYFSIIVTFETLMISFSLKSRLLSYIRI